jgi:hypothetical protein
MTGSASRGSASSSGWISAATAGSPAPPGLSHPGGGRSPARQGRGGGGDAVRVLALLVVLALGRGGCVPVLVGYAAGTAAFTTKDGPPVVCPDSVPDEGCRGPRARPASFQRSPGFRPVFLLTFATIAGPISTPS